MVYPTQERRQYAREPLTDEQADRLSNACQTTKEKLIIWTLLDTGLRVSELCSLTPKHILWQQRKLRIKGKGGPFGSRSKQRIVPLSLRARTLLEPYFTLQQEWFCGRRQAQNIVRSVANRAQIADPQVTPHVLRHTFATAALQKGISLAALQKILGHDRLSTTAIYLNLTEQHVTEEFHAKW